MTETLDIERPRTAEQIAALPEGGGFRFEERLIDGVLRTCPVAPDLILFWSDDTDVTRYVDADGVRWKLVRYSDGRWARQRKN